MIISRLDLKAFGHFENVSLDLSAGPHRFHLVYGPNESGKSTSLRAIASLLFGFPHSTSDNYKFSNTQLRIGGLLVDDGEELECVRRKGNKATLRDSAEENLIDEAVMQRMLGGITQETFLTRFGLSHQELVSGGHSIVQGEGDLGQMLFSAGFGVGRLRDIQDELEQATTRLFAPRASKSRINAAIKDLDEKRSELREVQVPTAAYTELQQRIAAKREEADHLNQQIQQCAIQLDRLRSFQQALPLLPRWRRNQQSLKELADVPLLDEGFTERRRQATSDREVARNRLVELQSHLDELRERLDAIPNDTQILSHAVEIQSLFQEAPAREKAERDCIGLIRNRESSDRTITELLAQLSIKTEVESDQDHVIDAAIEELKVPESVRTQIHELAGSYEKLISRRNDASETLETVKRRLEDVQQRLEEMGTPLDPEVVSAAIEAVGNPQTLIESVTAQQDVCEASRRQSKALLRRLKGFDGTAREAAELSPPAESARRRLAEEIGRCERRLSDAKQRREEQVLDRRETMQQIREDQHRQPLPTLEELKEARERRDSLLHRWITRSDGEPVELAELNRGLGELRESVLAADQIADTIRNHHEQVHRRQSLAQKVETIDERLAHLDDETEAARRDLDEAQSQWEEAWDACGVAAAPPETMERWVSDHQQLCELFQRLTDEEKRLEQFRSSLKLKTTRLRKVLETANVREPVNVGSDYQGDLFEAPAEDELIHLYEEATALRSSLLHSRQQFDQLRRRSEELAEELPQAETRFESAQQQVDQWREQWRRTTAAFVKSDDRGTNEVLRMLDQITELHSAKRERDILNRRIRSTMEDDEAYRDRLGAVAEAVDHPVDANHTPGVLAQSLYQRLQSEQTAARGRETLQEQINLAVQKLQDAESRQSACDVVLKELCREAGCDSPEKLPQIERAARQRSECQSAVSELENQLSMLAGDEPLETFVEQAEQQQAALLEADIDARESELQSLNKTLAGIQEEIGAMKHQIETIDGRGRASELAQSVQVIAGEITHDCEEYARLKVAAVLLKQAIEHYRSANESPVLQRASHYFHQLTCGEYCRLRPDYDARGKSTLFGINRNDQEVPAGLMSEGTADALYLALRLASIQNQIEKSKPVPLVIDDCLIQLDDERAAAALQAFSDLSTRTQIILFTHHQHLLELAEANLPEGGFHLHRLLGGANAQAE